MKKPYQKPYLAVESFQLDAAIATSCNQQNTVKMNHDLDACNFLNVSASFTQFGTACPTNVLLVRDANNYFCYHGPEIDIQSISINS